MGAAQHWQERGGELLCRRVLAQTEDAGLDQLDTLTSVHNLPSCCRRGGVCEASRCLGGAGGPERVLGRSIPTH